MHGRPLLHGAAPAITVLNGAEPRSSLMPSLDAVDCSACIDWPTHSMPEASCSRNSSLAPFTPPAPHWFAPDPGRLQVLRPFSLMSQPWASRSFCALSGSYG